MTDEIRLVIPAEEDFRPLAHRVVGGVALKADLTYAELDDLQVALEALLALRDDEDDLVLTLATGDGMLRAAVGPFAPEALGELDDEGPTLGLRRVLETVADSFEVEERADGTWVELAKRAAEATTTGGS